jgi:hypothetical protein
MSKISLSLGALFWASSVLAQVPSVGELPSSSPNILQICDCMDPSKAKTSNCQSIFAASAQEQGLVPPQQRQPSAAGIPSGTTGNNAPHMGGVQLPF